MKCNQSVQTVKHVWVFYANLNCLVITECCNSLVSGHVFLFRKHLIKQGKEQKFGHRFCMDSQTQRTMILQKEFLFPSATVPTFIVASFSSSGLFSIWFKTSRVSRSIKTELEKGELQLRRMKRIKFIQVNFPLFEWMIEAWLCIKSSNLLFWLPTLQLGGWRRILYVHVRCMNYALKVFQCSVSHS